MGFQDQEFLRKKKKIVSLISSLQIPLDSNVAKHMEEAINDVSKKSKLNEFSILQNDKNIKSSNLK